MLEGVYTSSESDDDSVFEAQTVYVQVEEEPPEIITFGESAKRYREYAEKAGLLRKTPVTINVVNFPRGEVKHGMWKSDIESRMARLCVGQSSKLVLDSGQITNVYAHFDSGDVALSAEEFNPRKLSFEYSSKPVNRLRHFGLCLKDLYVSGLKDPSKLYSDCTMGGVLDVLKLPKFNRHNYWDIYRILNVADLLRRDSRGAGKFMDTMVAAFEEITFYAVRGYKLNIEGLLGRSLGYRIIKNLSITRCDITQSTLMFALEIFKQEQCQKVTFAHNSIECRLSFFKYVFDSFQKGEVEGTEKLFSVDYRPSEKEVIEAYVASKAVETLETRKSYLCRGSNNPQSVFYVTCHSDHVVVST